MKNTLLLSIIIFLFSCGNVEKDMSAIVDAPSSNGTPDVDPATPSNALPYITDGSASTSAGDWSIDWSDEFNTGSLCTDKWAIQVTPDNKSRSTSNRHPNVHWWGWKSDRVKFENGDLVLESKKTAWNRLECGSVNSNNLYETTYGYFEARIKIANPDQGSHTAFWFQGDNQGVIDQSGADGAEIDVFESVWTNNKTKSVVHIDGYDNNNGHQSSTKQYNTASIASGYHTYGLYWEPGMLKIYYDGELKTTYRGAWVPMVDEFLWLSIGASFNYYRYGTTQLEPTSGAGGFATRGVGSVVKSYVDYVRVWKSNQTPYYRMKNRETGKWFKTYGTADNSEIKQCPTNQFGDWTTWSLQETSNGYFYFVNENTGKYFRPETSNDNSRILLKPTSNGGAWTQWKFVKPSGSSDFYFLRNRETGKHIRPSGSGDNSPIQLKPSSVTSNWTQWQTIEK